MKILKYRKINKNQYKLFFDNNDNITLFDEIILKYKLLFLKEIDVNTYKKIIEDNNNYKSYDLALNYISKKLRCENEVVDYLKKKNINNDNITKTVNKLKENGFLNEIDYIKAYSNDKFNLTSYGPEKIKKELKKLNLNSELIENTINFSENDIIFKLEKLIDKKIKQSKGYSGNVLKKRIEVYFYNLGYSKKHINYILDKKDFNDEGEYQKEYDKLLKKYEKKYNGFELDQIIKQKLYLKGFRK